MTRPFAEVMRRRTDRRPVALWLAASALDLGITLAVIGTGIGREAWPPSALAFAIAGPFGLVAWKVGLMSLMPFAVRLQPTPTWCARVWWFVAIGAVVPVAWNVGLLALAAI